MYMYYITYIERYRYESYNIDSIYYNIYILY